MLSLNEGPYLGLHGNKTSSYQLNISSLVSVRNSSPASSIIKKCTLNWDKTSAFLKENGFTLVSSHSYSMLDDTIKESDFIEAFSKGSKCDYLVDDIIINTYESNGIFIQVSAKEFNIRIDSESKMILEVDLVEFAFIESLRPKVETLYSELIKSAYQQSHQFFDEDSPIIGIIGSTPDGLYVKEYNLGKKAKSLTDEELDLHYGDSFSQFHNQLNQLLGSDSKGLIIFHGDPGTGKTYYIRMLLKELTKSKKNVLYVPSNFIDSFLDPNFITFLSDWILDQNNPTIILLEDAECLVESRDSGIRSLGISNLLNITDGILNDILGTQIILTFNTNLDFIDKALLRPERLLARKEFSNLSKEESQRLLDHLKIDHKTDSDMSLADIYSIKNSRSVLYHNVKEKKVKVGFI
jgi:hypothetical protein